MRANRVHVHKEGPFRWRHSPPLHTADPATCFTVCPHPPLKGRQPLRLALNSGGLAAVLIRQAARDRRGPPAALACSAEARAAPACSSLAAPRAHHPPSSPASAAQRWPTAAGRRCPGYAATRGPKAATFPAKAATAAGFRVSGRNTLRSAPRTRKGHYKLKNQLGAMPVLPVGVLPVGVTLLLCTLCTADLPTPPLVSLFVHTRVVSRSDCALNSGGLAAVLAPPPSVLTRPMVAQTEVRNPAFCSRFCCCCARWACARTSRASCCSCSR